MKVKNISYFFDTLFIVNSTNLRIQKLLMEAASSFPDLSDSEYLYKNYIN